MRRRGGREGIWRKGGGREGKRKGGNDEVRE